MNELEQMKEQLGIMRAKLETQAIVNDRLLRRSMSQRMSWVKRYAYVQIFLLLPFIVVVYALMSAQLGLSWWLYAYTVLMCTADMVIDTWINNFYITRRDFQEQTLLVLGKKLARQKTLRWRSLAFGFALLLPWLAWLCYEGYVRIPAPMNLGFLISVAIGGGVGFCIGFGILWRMQRTNDALLEEIRAIEAGDEGEAAASAGN